MPYREGLKQEKWKEGIKRCTLVSPCVRERYNRRGRGREQYNCTEEGNTALFFNIYQHKGGIF